MLDKSSTDEFPVVHWLTGWARENLGADPRGGAIFDRVQSALGPKAISTVVLRQRMQPARRKPQLLILCSPPGIPKGAFVAPLVERYPQALGAVVSTTSRPPLEHEENGVEYHFISREEARGGGDRSRSLRISINLARTHSPRSLFLSAIVRLAAPRRAAPPCVRAG